MDALDKRYLENVPVKNLSTGEESLTNSRGYFNLQANLGDTIQVNYPGFIELNIAAGEERFLFLELQDAARLLPTFEVKAETYAFRFKDGRLLPIDPNEPDKPSRKGQITAGTPGGANGGVALYGVMSYFTKKAKQAREYEKKKLWHERRKGYYLVVDSDSVRRNLMVKYQLARKDWDDLIIRYNSGNRGHEFLDWSEEKVYNSLQQFIGRESSLR